MRIVVVGLIKLWRRFISPLYGDVCKYFPSCSEYGLEAVQLHGTIRGLGLTVWRLLRCNPFSLGGVDYVPKSARWFLWEDDLATSVAGVGQNENGAKPKASCRLGGSSKESAIADSAAYSDQISSTRVEAGEPFHSVAYWDRTGTAVAHSCGSHSCVQETVRPSRGSGIPSRHSEKLQQSVIKTKVVSR